MVKASKSPQRGEIWLAKFDKIKEFSKPYRPVLVISNNDQNEFDSLITIAALTTEDIKDVKPFEIFINNAPETGLDEPSKIQMNYPYTINKKLRLIERIRVVNNQIMAEAKVAWNLSFDWH